MNAGDALDPMTFTVTRADLVAYADASGDHNPIHQDEDVARSVGLPGVIAHGMYTLALAGRAVADWTGGAEVVELGCKFTSPVVVPADGGRRSSGRRHREVGRRRPGHARARGDLRRREGARHAQGRRACLSLPELLATTPRCASAARLGDWVRATTEAELVDAVSEADAAGTPVLVLGGGSNLVVADEGFDGLVVEVATSGVTPDTDDCEARLRRRAGDASPPARPGTTSWPPPSSGAGPASRRSPASPAASAPPRSRTSAPTARRSPRPSRRSGSGTAPSSGVRTFAAADCGFGYRTRRFKADPGRHVVLDGRPSSSARARWAPRRVRRAGPHPRRRGRASARRWPTCDEPSWACGPARAWCSTRPTTTPGARARSSPTRSSPRAGRGAARRCRPAGRSPTAP